MFTPLAFALAQSNSQIDAAYGVLERAIGSRAKEFQLELMPSAGGNDSFELLAAGGKVTIRGTSGVAIDRAAYEYLKDKCNSFVSWEGSNIRLPKPLPNDHRTGSCPVRFRHYYNICTFGYTTAFWNWDRWQKEIDWMAFHGINMPLAMTGQDKVWQTVFRSYGVPDSSIEAFFSGPAFQPWHWMGNLNGHGGPTPQSWIDGQAELQKKILARERSLGMKPVVPGFSGFVPVDFAKYQPQVKLQSPTAWCGFAPTTFVDIRDPMFVEIGKKFVEEYRKEFGSDHLYLCDTFNEQNPQFPEATKLDDLANAGRSVYEGLKQADPDAVWVMQGWLFYNERDYWKGPEVEALLSKVPDGRMIILDLSCEQYEVWRNQPAVARKGFIFCTLHNFGQNTGLGGDLQTYVNKAILASFRPIPFKPGDAPSENLLGFGLTPEGIDTNPVVYELMTDAMWSSSERYWKMPESGSRADNTQIFPTFQVDRWLDDYAHARYGVDLPETRAAWQILREALYSKDLPWYHDGWRGRPSAGKKGRPVRQMHMLGQALHIMMEVAPKLRNNPLFQRDLVDVCKTYLGGIADRESYLANASFAGGDAETYGMLKRAFFQTLGEIDQVMACRPEHRLSTWIDEAKAWGTTPEEKLLMERNARLQITAWDGKGVLTDYANKEWAGLVSDLIVRRWQKYFSDLESEKKPATSYLDLEMSWVNDTKPPKESRPGDAAAVVSKILAAEKGALDNLETALARFAEPPGNLARQGKATDDGHTEPGGSPQNAIDGDMDTYWAASPSPCQWKLDLGAVHPIKTIQLFPYWGDGRYYQFTVEVSADGEKWSTVVDQSKNEQPSTAAGQKSVLAAPVSARYLRVNMLRNSANVGVHLVEVRVYEH
ncbi:MAG TPA: alpha-N-acetylglucosaminidase TIM-barrel domain-containing protein [Fimbriimonadaceae bacterium]|nr:alpha-N-acetylglucosaminidase TIM-barrel domain-containing protein [Fimbriimonadaceae bacterium]